MWTTRSTPPLRRRSLEIQALHCSECLLYAFVASFFRLLVSDEEKMAIIQTEGARLRVWDLVNDKNDPSQEAACRAEINRRNGRRWVLSEVMSPTKHKVGTHLWSRHIVLSARSEEIHAGRSRANRPANRPISEFLALVNMRRIVRSLRAVAVKPWQSVMQPWESLTWTSS